MALADGEGGEIAFFVVAVVVVGFATLRDRKRPSLNSLIKVEASFWHWFWGKDGLGVGGSLRGWRCLNGCGARG